MAALKKHNKKLKELMDGLELETEITHELKIKNHTLHVRLPIDPAKTSSWDDRFILIEDRAGEKFQQVQTVKNDHVPGDRFVDLEFYWLKPDCSYSLQVNPGREGEPYYLFEKKSFGDLFAA